MSKSWKIVGGFAAPGFALPLVLLAYWKISGADVSAILFYLCPTSIMSMALDHATTAMAVEVWLMIIASNALFYALPGAVIALVVKYRKHQPVT